MSPTMDQLEAAWDALSWPHMEFVMFQEQIRGGVASTLWTIFKFSYLITAALPIECTAMSFKLRRRPCWIGVLSKTWRWRRYSWFSPFRLPCLGLQLILLQIWFGSGRWRWCFAPEVVWPLLSASSSERVSWLLLLRHLGCLDHRRSASLHQCLHWQIFTPRGSKLPSCRCAGLWALNPWTWASWGRRSPALLPGWSYSWCSC